MTCNCVCSICERTAEQVAAALSDGKFSYIKIANADVFADSLSVFAESELVINCIGQQYDHHVQQITIEGHLVSKKRHT